MNYVFIMRGVPGSGKSTLARQIAGEKGMIHSTDDYFYCDGIYRFDATRLADYHARNLEAFCESLRFEHPIVICDNTNVKKAHYMPYLEAAHTEGYSVAIITMPHPTPSIAASRSIHNVPESVIWKMIHQWEP